MTNDEVETTKRALQALRKSVARALAAERINPDGARPRAVQAHIDDLAEVDGILAKIEAAREAPAGGTLRVPHRPAVRPDPEPGTVR